MGMPLPNITDIFDQLGKAKYFTVLDCVSGFHQIAMHPDDAHKTAFSTPNGHYEFVKMPFGLLNAPREYAYAMGVTLDGLIGNGVFAYMDDLVLYSDTLESHNRIFNLVMDRLRKANWQLEPFKCELLKREVIYVGHVMSEKVIKPDPKKLSAIKDYPRPTNQKQIKQWIGLAGYYRKFVNNFAKIA